MPSLDLFAPKALASTRPTRGGGCQRQPGPACPRVTEGRAICPGREACEHLGEQEAARLRARPCDDALLTLCPTPEVECRACVGMKDGLCSDGRTPCPGPTACDTEQLALGVDPSELGHTVPTEDEVREAQLAAGLPWPVPPPVRRQAMLARDLFPRMPYQTSHGGNCTTRLDGSPPMRFELTEGYSGPRTCGACGSTTGVVLYERGPLAGQERCWPCAKGVLEP